MEDGEAVWIWICNFFFSFQWSKNLSSRPRRGKLGLKEKHLPPTSTKKKLNEPYPPRFIKILEAKERTIARQTRKFFFLTFCNSPGPVIKHGPRAICAFAPLFIGLAYHRLICLKTKSSKLGRWYFFRKIKFYKKKTDFSTWTEVMIFRLLINEIIHGTTRQLHSVWY